MQKYQIQYFNMKTSLIMVAVINTIYKTTANTAKTQMQELCGHFTNEDHSCKISPTLKNTGKECEVTGSWHTLHTELQAAVSLVTVKMGNVKRDVKQGQ